jgi:thiamine-phosphate pyrophosphorylase
MFPEHASYQKKVNFFREKVTIYPVSCEPLANGRSDIEWLEGVLAGGAKIVQLRDKYSDDRAFYQKALIFREKTNNAGALFIVNNRIDIAMLAHAGSELIIGVSCNEKKQVSTVKERGGSYYNIGPIYTTKTKRNLTPFLGSDAIESFSSLCDLPFTVMGGVKLEHVKDLVARGAQRIAVVTALTQAKDIAAETRLWIEAIDMARSK